MKEIDEYLNKLYRHLNASDQEIRELKDEMKHHLLESVHELETEGKSPKESVHIAIERFGDAGMIGRELPKILMVSRRRFSIMLLAVCCAALIITVGLILTSFDNFNKLKELKQADSARQEIIQELQQSQKTNLSYKRIFDKTSELAANYDSNSEKLSKVLDAKYNIESIDQIGEMNNTFKYHNAVLMAVAVIAADTDYECPYFIDIAELGVMKLSGSSSIIDLAATVRGAKTTEVKENVMEQIQLMKKASDFATYQQALDYNNRLAGK